jgi:hypothetical protein
LFGGACSLDNLEVGAACEECLETGVAELDPEPLVARARSGEWLDARHATNAPFGSLAVLDLHSLGEHDWREHEPNLMTMD